MKTLKDVPVFCSIRYIKNGREMYLKKVKLNGKVVWYDFAKCEQVKECNLPRNWEYV